MPTKNAPGGNPLPSDQRSIRRPLARLRACSARAVLAVAAVLLAAPPPAAAAPIPFAGRRVQLTAREQPVALFLQDLFGLVDLPVAVSERVHGAVNGNFDGPVENVWRKVARSFNLIAYYDGSVVHVYAPSELVTRILPLEPDVAARVQLSAVELMMPDAHHRLRTTGEGTLVASGTRRFVEQVEELTRAQTAATAASPALGFRVIFLRYAWAHDVSVGFGGRQVVVPGVASIVRALMTANPNSQVRTSVQEQPLAPTVPKLRGQGLIGQGRAGADAAALPAGSGAALLAAYGAGLDAAGAAGAAGAGGVPAALQPATVADASQARVEADTRLNAVIVRDVPERLAQYERLIESLDVEPQALEIEATIIDINTDRLRELGINWRLTRGRGSLLFGDGTDADLRLNGNTPVDQIVPVGRGAFLSAVLGGANELALRVNALQEQGAARIVSSPQVLTLSNVEAVFDTSRTFYVRVAGREEVDLFSVSAGTTLRVTPHVFRDGEGVRIKLLVAIDDGALSQQQVDQIPIVERATVNTQALIFEGESLLVGGLTREASSSGVTKVPLLGDIPFIGNLFKTTNDAGSRTERLFLIAPRLMPARRAAAAGQGPAVPAPTPGTAGPTAPAPGPAPVPAPPPAPVPAPPPGAEPTPPRPTSMAPADVNAPGRAAAGNEGPTWPDPLEASR